MYNDLDKINNGIWKIAPVSSPGEFRLKNFLAIFFILFFCKWNLFCMIWCLMVSGKSPPVSLSRPYLFKFFKGCLPQILLGPLLDTSSHISCNSVVERQLTPGARLVFKACPENGGSGFWSYEIELRNRVAQNDVTLWVSNSEIFIEILLSTY